MKMRRHSVRNRCRQPCWGSDGSFLHAFQTPDPLGNPLRPGTVDREPPAFEELGFLKEQRLPAPGVDEVEEALIFQVLMDRDLAGADRLTRLDVNAVDAVLADDVAAFETGNLGDARAGVGAEPRHPPPCGPDVV